MPDSYIRILLKIDEGHRRFWNVAYSNRELYFMPAYRVSRVWMSTYDTSTFTFNLDKAMEESVEADPGAKFSYHRTGQFHWKNSGEVELKYTWPEKDQLDRPFRLLAGFSRALNHYDFYPPNRSLNRGGANYREIIVPSSLQDKRLYFELWVSPEGEFDIPEPLINYQASEPMWKKEFSENPGTKLSDELLLFTPINPNPHAEMQSLEPNVEFLFVLEGIRNGEHHGHILILSR